MWKGLNHAIIELLVMPMKSKHFQALNKVAKVKTELKPHQKRVVQRIQEQPGLVVAHGLGSGKCARAGTLVYTNKGLVPIESLFSGELVGTDELTPVTGLQIVNWNPEGELSWTPVKELYRQQLPPEEETYKVTTIRGHSVEITGAHPLPVVRDGTVQWIPVRGVTTADWLAVAGHLPELISATQSWTPTLSRFLTWQIAEGWESPTGGTTQITQHNQERLTRLREDLHKILPTKTGHVHAKHLGGQ